MIQKGMKKDRKHQQASNSDGIRQNGTVCLWKGGVRAAIAIGQVLSCIDWWKSGLTTVRQASNCDLRVGIKEQRDAVSISAADIDHPV